VNLAEKYHILLLEAMKARGESPVPMARKLKKA
jgi:hypothetical protein